MRLRNSRENRQCRAVVRCDGHDFDLSSTGVLPAADRDGWGTVIGVLCEPCEEPAVREFFELFKTPWATFDPSGSYDAVIVGAGAPAPEDIDVRLVIRFCDERLDRDSAGTHAGDHGGELVVTADGARLPIFRGAAQVGDCGRVLGWRAADLTPIVCECEEDGRRVITCGYDLFHEVEFLLGRGQPVEHAATPTLDLHIELLRRWLVEAGIELLELHPTPPQCGLSPPSRTTWTSWASVVIGVTER